MGVDLRDAGVDLRLCCSREAEALAARSREEFIRELEAEKVKIEVFKRDLPLCVRIVSDVIEMMREERMRPAAEAAPAPAPVAGGDEEGGAGDKRSWMSSAQLWVDAPKDGRDAAENQNPKKGEVEKRAMHQSAFSPFKNLRPAAPPPELKLEEKVPPPPASILRPEPAAKNCFFTVSAGAGVERDTFSHLAVQAQSHQQQHRSGRKSRRCWSPELHQKFVAALRELGGAQVATPKQIRELMKVDGLTNDEVKSHLQKYRLHNRRSPTPSPAAIPVKILANSGSPQGPFQYPGITAAAGDSCEEEDGKSECYNWE